jgi:hypothetical protein
MKFPFTIATSKLAVLLLTVGSLTVHAFDHSYKNYDHLLKSHVSKTSSGNSTKINYQALKSNSTKLEVILNDFSGVSEKEFKSFSKNQQLAFLINSYNAFTIKLIVDHYPIKSIKKIGGVFSNPWKKEFFKLRGKTTTLDAIEHQMLRKDYVEPRIHFAVNCASIGCPPLRSEAFIPTQLNKQLNDQAKLFLKNPEQNSFNIKSKKIVLSKIFKWFEGDFTKVSPSVASYVLNIWGENSLDEKDYEIEFNDYNWNLNEK